MASSCSAEREGIKALSLKRFSDLTKYGSHLWAYYPIISNLIAYLSCLNPHSLDINAFLATRLNHENGVLEPRLLAGRHFALAINVPDWRCQGLGYIRAAFYKIVPDSMRRGTARSTASLTWCAEQEAHNVGLVGMIELPSRQSA